MAAALKMAWMAVGDGVRTIVATPHQLGVYARNNAGVIRGAMARLQAVLATEDVPLKVVAGAEVRLDPDLAGKLRRGDALAIGQGRYVLVELPNEIHVPLERLLVELAAMGKQPVLAHPERNTSIQADPSVLRPLMAAGCITQLTAGSLMGAYGPAVQQLADLLLARGMVHLVASNAHGTGRQRPLLGQTFHYLCRRLGRRRAELLCRDNPSALIEGGELVLPGPGMAGDTASVRGWSRAG